MILQALYEYYERKASDPESNVAPEGWEWKEIPYLIAINKGGSFVGINDTREGEGKIKRARKFLVPQSEKRSVGIKANLLWDNIEYALGANPRKRKDIKHRHDAFQKRVNDILRDRTISSIRALQKFLENDPISQIKQSGYADVWKELSEETPFIAFKIDGDKHNTLCDDIREIDFSSRAPVRDSTGVCLITGETKIEVARLHPDIKGVRGTNTKGATLVAFNLPAFESYNKTQNYNAPISKGAAFAYTAALNILLGKDSENKVSVGDATTAVFWADKQKEKKQSFDLENQFAWYVTDKKDDPDRGVQAVKSLYTSFKTGSLSASTEQFYVLGLAPNAARISVRFFRQGTVREFGEKIKMHFDDFEIVRSSFDPEYLSLYRILTATALQYKMENVPPNLAGSVIESILDGTPYPVTLLQQCVRRIRAEVSKRDQNGKSTQNVTRTRAAILKAFINRFNRIHKPLEKEVTVSLDRTNTSPGYLLGRLFSVLEQVQNAANNYKEPNAGIRDRFYGAFSSTPITVLPLLEKLYGHHLGKIEKSKGFFESIKGEIVDKLNPQNIPAHLTMEQQALFAIGYYHQRQEFFTKKKESDQSEQPIMSIAKGDLK